MDAAAIIDALSRAGLDRFPDGIAALSSADGMPTIAVARERLVEVCRVLRDEPALRFALLVDITAVDYFPREPRFGLVYLLACPGTGGFGDRPKRLRIKVQVPGTDVHVPTISGLWTAANWAEREIYDFFGIHVDGHPDLRRILMPEDWEGFPLRKDYPVQIKQPVKTYEPLQISEEEFVANVEAARTRARKE